MSTWAPGNYDGATYEYDAFDNIRRNVLGQSNASSGRDIRYQCNSSTNCLSGLGFPDGTTVAQYQHDPRGNLTRGLFYSGGVVASIIDFEYDRANTLQRVTGLDPSIGEQRYRYDAHGHRIDVHTAPGQYKEARHWPVYTRDGTLSVVSAFPVSGAPMLMRNGKDGHRDAVEFIPYRVGKPVQDAEVSCPPSLGPSVDLLPH